MSKDKEKQLAYQRAHYQRNKEQRYALTRQKYAETLAWFKSYKSSQKCNRCPENHIATLDFHHVGDKEDNIHQLIKRGWTKERLMTEIDKCEVLCANCHRKHHFKEKEDAK